MRNAPFTERPRTFRQRAEGFVGQTGADVKREGCVPALLLGLGAGFGFAIVLGLSR